jgi:hypothetical protein
VTHGSRGNCVALQATYVFIFSIFVLASAQSNVLIAKDIARVLLLPYGDAKQIGIAKKSERYKVLNKENDWYQIEYKGSIGWLFKDNVRPVLFDKITTPAPPVQAPARQQQPAVVQPVPQPQHQQAEPLIPDFEEEKFEQVLEQPQKKAPHKPKKTQNFTVEMPPAAIVPIAGSNELPTYHVDTTATQTPPTQKTVAPPPVAPAATAQKTTPTSPQPQQALAEQPDTDDSNLLHYFEITKSSVKVLAFVSPESPILGMAKKNECFALLHAGDSWCKIQFGNNPGWVERRAGRFVKAPTSTKNLSGIFIFSAVAAGVLLLIIVVITVAVLLLRTKAAGKVSVKKDLLIIAVSEKEIQYSLTDSTTSMSKCFFEIGFNISYAKDFNYARNFLAHNSPDVIVVDWQMGSKVFSSLESVLSERTSTSKILVIFYNVPDASLAEKNSTLPDTHYLGLIFSDRDIFKLVTPIINTKLETKSIRASVESSALGGEISHSSLIEVMQFIEIGRKTGCLYTSIDKPFGLIYFEQGRLTYSATQNLQGRDAVFEILNLKKGHFHFVLDKTFQTKNVEMSTLEILMEWTKTVDEAHRN